MNNHSQIVQKLWNYCNVLPACAKQRAAGRRDDLSAWDLPALQQAGAQAGADYPSIKLRTGLEQVTPLSVHKEGPRR